MRWLALLMAAAVIAFTGLQPAWAATPAGYVVEAELPDGAGSGAVIRNGVELPARLLMPVYEGDVVFVRGDAGRIVVELGEGETVVVGPDMPRLEVRGEIATGDDAWSLLDALAAALSGDSDETPENMAARGDPSTIIVAASGRGRNLLPLGLGEVGLQWSGGTGPYRVSLEGTGGKTVLAETAEPVAVAPLAAATGEKFVITIEDSRGVSRRLRFAWREKTPEAPSALLARAGGQAAVLARAAWLAAAEDGAWALAAAENLRRNPFKDESSARLRSMILSGWKPR